MTRSEPHPQRCETCEHREIVHNHGMGTHRPRCKITKWFLDAYAPTTIEHDFIDKLGCASHSSASEPVPDSATLIEYAQREWANREERRGIHEKVSWETGWMSGYLTSEGNIQQARQQERERVLSCVQEDVNDLTKEVAHGLYTNQGIFEELQKLSRRIESLRQQEEP